MDMVKGEGGAPRGGKPGDERAHKIGTRNVDRNGERSQSHMVLHIRVRLKSWFLHILVSGRMHACRCENKETIRSHAHP